jgi:hypothetical protein
MSIKNFFAFGIVILMTACSQSVRHAPPPPPEEDAPIENPSSLSDVFLISEDALPEMLSLAKRGDSESAFKLFLHFNSLENSTESGKWLSVAAQNGHPAALFWQWAGTSASADCNTLLSSTSLIKKSAEQGYKPAIEALPGYLKSIQEKCGK